LNAIKKDFTRNMAFVLTILEIGPRRLPTHALQLLHSASSMKAPRQDPENTDLLSNLSLCHVDLGQLDKGMFSYLHLCFGLAPGQAHYLRGQAPAT